MEQTHGLLLQMLKVIYLKIYEKIGRNKIIENKGINELDIITVKNILSEDSCVIIIQKKIKVIIILNKTQNPQVINHSSMNDNIILKNKQNSFFKKFQNKKK